MDERRSSERYRVWFPVTVVTASGEEGTAITYDVSAAGILMACPGRLEAGEAVTLRFRVEQDEDERSFPAKIVRSEENDEDDGLWRYRMAAHFDEPHPELENMLERESKLPDP
jgi:hypothetical protein